jgi:hypothetical protein
MVSNSVIKKSPIDFLNIKRSMSNECNDFQRKAEHPLFNGYCGCSLHASETVRSSG